MNQIEIGVMTTEDDVAVVSNLVRTYVEWLIETYPEESEDLLSYFSPERMHQALADIPVSYFLPKGIALIGRVSGVPVGCVLASPLEPGIAEMKRLFVAPSARGLGLGTELLHALIAQLQALGYPTIRLDTAIFLADAISLYRRFGFVEIAPYTTLPPGAVPTAIFMERRSW